MLLRASLIQHDVVQRPKGAGWGAGRAGPGGGGDGDGGGPGPGPSGPRGRHSGRDRGDRGEGPSEHRGLAMERFFKGDMPSSSLY